MEGMLCEESTGRGRRAGQSGGSLKREHVIVQVLKKSPPGITGHIL